MSFILKLMSWISYLSVKMSEFEPGCDVTTSPPDPKKFQTYLKMGKLCLGLVLIG